MLEYATFEEASAALAAMHGRDMRLDKFSRFAQSRISEHRLSLFGCSIQEGLLHESCMALQRGRHQQNKWQQTCTLQ